MSKFDHLLGFKYRAGTQDCLSVIRAYYRDVWGLRIPNYARPTHFWDDPRLDLYQQHYHTNGFELVTVGAPQIGDLFLMPLATQMNTHGAVMVANNLILHHLPDQVSSTENLRPKWWGRVMVHLRHPAITKAQQTTPEVRNVHDILNHHVFRDPGFQAAAARVEAERKG